MLTSTLSGSCNKIKTMMTAASNSNERTATRSLWLPAVIWCIQKSVFCSYGAESGLVPQSSLRFNLVSTVLIITGLTKRCNGLFRAMVFFSALPAWLMTATLTKWKPRTKTSLRTIFEMEPSSLEKHILPLATMLCSIRFPTKSCRIARQDLPRSRFLTLDVNSLWQTDRSHSACRACHSL